MMCDRKRIEVIIDTNKISEAVGLTLNSILHLTVTYAIEDANKIMANLISLGNISRRTCVSQVEHRAIVSVNVIELCNYHGITISDWSNAYCASIG